MILFFLFQREQSKAAIAETTISTRRSIMIHKEMVNWTASFSKHYYIEEIPLVISSYRDKAQDRSLNYPRVRVL